MSLPKIYLETTIPSYLTARRSRDLRLAAHQEVTEEWWNDHRQRSFREEVAAFLKKHGFDAGPGMLE